MSETVLKLYKTSLPSCQLIMPNGKYIYFKQGKYATADEAEIEYLESEIKFKHPHIYIDSAESTVRAEVYNDPMAALREKFFKEFTAAQTKDMGTSDKSAGAGAGMVNSAALATLKESNSKK